MISYFKLRKYCHYFFYSNVHYIVDYKLNFLLHKNLYYTINRNAVETKARLPHHTKIPPNQCGLKSATIFLKFIDDQLICNNYDQKMNFIPNHTGSVNVTGNKALYFRTWMCQCRNRTLSPAYAAEQPATSVVVSRPISSSVVAGNIVLHKMKCN